MNYFLYSDALPVPRDSKQFTHDYTFQYKPSNPELIRHHLLYQAFTLRAIIHLPNHPMARYQTTTAPLSQSPLKLFKPSNLKPAYLAFFISSCGNHNEGSCLSSLSLPVTKLMFSPVVAYDVAFQLFGNCE